MTEEGRQWPTEMVLYAQAKCPYCPNIVVHSGDGVARCGGCNFSGDRCACTAQGGNWTTHEGMVLLLRAPCSNCGDSLPGCPCDAGEQEGGAGPMVLFARLKCPRCPNIVVDSGVSGPTCRGCGIEPVRCDCRPGPLRRALKALGLAGRQRK